MNTLVGSLDEPSKSFLFDSLIAERVDNSKISQIIDDTLRKLHVERPNFYLLLSDAAPYMIKAGKNLKNFYENMSHVTCFSHLLHNCAMEIKSHFKDIDFLIASIKTATVKNHSRRSMFSEIGSPPNPVVTRWGSWLESCAYYAEHLPKVIEIVNNFEDDGLISQRAKEAVAQPSLTASLVSVSQYKKIVTMIKNFESNSYTLLAAYTDMKNLRFQNDLCRIEDYISQRIEKNEAKIICEMTDAKFSPAEYALLQNAQPTSADVERSFSLSKNILKENRNFASENIGDYIICAFNFK